MPRVTVGIPFYNAESTLLEAVRSVFAQTFRHWELVLLDDGLTDRSLELACSIDDPRVIVRRSPHNRGLAQSLNEIARVARAPYLARMDADDLMHPERLEQQVRFLDGHPGIPLVTSAAYVLDRSGRPAGIRELAAPDTSPAAMLARNRILHPSVTGRTQWFRDHSYDPAYHRAEDHELWCRALGTTAVGHVGQPLLFYRDAALGNARKYAQSCLADRVIYRRYGPAQIGRFATARLLAKAFLKPLAYAVSTRVGLEARLLRARYSELSEVQRAAAEHTLQRIAGTAIPRPSLALSSQVS